MAVAADNTTEGSPVGISPDVVTNLVSTDNTTSSVSLSWNSPEGESSFYRIEWTSGSGSSSFDTTDLSITITSLTPGVDYQFLVMAVAADNTTEGRPVGISLYTSNDYVTWQIVICFSTPFVVTINGFQIFNFR
uniref:Fibronectin type-III domain-containing protein n=1 Tax=Denticeps clupeoides TaxID=299321 RepID=A0AAY4CIW3_9TELE